MSSRTAILVFGEIRSHCDSRLYLQLISESDPNAIIERSKYYQEQRRTKQPFAPSAGSFFKNVYDHDLAQSLPTLPPSMKEAGVVPAGYLIESCGIKGAMVGGAQSSEKHANFLINATKTATATDFRELATLVKQAVHARFGVTLEEEVLYCGDWGGAVTHEPVAT